MTCNKIIGFLILDASGMTIIIDDVFYSTLQKFVSLADALVPTKCIRGRNLQQHPGKIYGRKRMVTEGDSMNWIVLCASGDSTHGNEVMDPLKY